MPTDGPREDPTTRPLPQGGQPSPYGSGPDRWAPADPYAAPGYQGGTSGGTTGVAPAGAVPARPYTDRPAQPWAVGPGQLPDATQVLDPPAGHGFPGRATAPGTPPAPPRRGGRPRWRSPAFLVPAAIGALLVLGAGATFAYVKYRGEPLQDVPAGTPSATGGAAALPSGRTWLSGVWTGGTFSVGRVKGFGDWRGQPVDVVTTYPSYKSWDEIKGSDWNVSVFDGFRGRLSYGLPLLPSEEPATLADVAAGKHDDVFRAVADVLTKHGRGDSFVRIGLEANGTWFAWGADAGRAEDFKAAYRHVQGVLKAAAPKLSIGFDIGCNAGFKGGSGRLDSLTKLYPGDDVVDVVGCDRYDQDHARARNQGEWDRALRPSDAAGLADVADFARKHGKKLAVPEWGVVSTARNGSGDNPFFVYAMYRFFTENKDVLAYENYFNEQTDELGSSIWSENQHPRSAAEYQKLWGAPPHLQGATS